MTEPPAAHGGRFDHTRAEAARATRGFWSAARMSHATKVGRAVQQNRATKVGRAARPTWPCVQGGCLRGFLLTAAADRATIVGRPLWSPSYARSHPPARATTDLRPHPTGPRRRRGRTPPGPARPHRRLAARCRLP